VFSRLSSLVIDGVTEQDGVVVVRTQTASWPVPFPGRGALTGQVHGSHGRTVADVPADSCPVLVRVGCGGFLPWVGCARRRWGTDGPVLEAARIGVIRGTSAYLEAGQAQGP
jgi:hypothetical protein